MTDCTNPGSHFDLCLDGVRQSSVLDMDLLQGVPKILRRGNLTNYPNGLVGTHTFTGEIFLNGELSGTFQRTITFNGAKMPSGKPPLHRERDTTNGTVLRTG